MNQTPDNAGSTDSPGGLLKQAREHAGLSVEKIAKDLYLDTRVIQAIEVNRFKDLGAPVYAKGYLRKYARLVGVTEEDVLAGYQKSGDAPPAPALIPVTMGSVPETRQPLPRWVLWLVFGLIVLAAMVTLLNLRSSNTEPVVQGALISQPLDAPGNVDVASDSAAAEPVSATTEAAVPAGGVTVRFSFSGDSWAEVYDAQNQQVLYEMGTANAVREVTASPPLRVVLGAAGVVRVNVNAQDVEIPATAVQADVAKFVVKADGSLE